MIELDRSACQCVLIDFHLYYTLNKIDLFFSIYGHS